MIRILHSLRRRLQAEDGVALMISIGALSALALVSASSVAFSTENSGNASRSKADQAAFALAEAGINNAMAVLSNPANDPTNASLLQPTYQDYEGGKATWSGVYDAATSTWTITATGEMRNPTGPSAVPVRRTISAKAPVVVGPQLTQPLANDAWNYLVATRTGNACDETFSSSVVTSAPLYIFGNLCLGSSSVVNGGPLSVRGSLTLGTLSTVGAVGTPIPEAHVAGGCGGHACTSADRVYATTLDQSPPVLSAPAPDWDFWYATAAPGPKKGCEIASGTVPVFDNNTARDKSVTTVFTLTSATSYTCRVGPPGNPTGELSWDATTRVLTIRGTIFIDGQAKVDNAKLNTYSGQGTIYLSGSFLVTSGSKLCAVATATDCDFSPGKWDPNKNLLAIVSNGNGGLGVLAGNSIQLGCFDRVQGALFGTNAVFFSSGAAPAKHQGPVVASTIVLSASAEVKPFGTLTSVPAGLPGQPPPRSGVGAPRDFTG
ncbi:MAG TPA: hypothetical protein VGQ84_00415 [Gaiellaceae bacterium]|jgi:hypothetical protein|nr:hypothetical protein [Gaiellaceae bacterium]